MAEIRKIKAVVVSIDPENKIVKYEKIPRQGTYRNGILEPKVYECSYSPNLDLRYSDDDFSDLSGEAFDIVFSDNAVVDKISKIED